MRGGFSWFWEIKRFPQQVVDPAQCLEDAKGTAWMVAGNCSHSDLINTAKPYFEKYTQGARDWLKALEAWKNKKQNKPLKTLQPWNWLHLVRGILKWCSCYPTTRDVPSLPLKIYSLLLQANTPPLLPPSYPLGIPMQQTLQGLGTALNPSSLLLSSCSILCWQWQLPTYQWLHFHNALLSISKGKRESSQHLIT